MPRIAVKAKAPFGIGVVFAYASEPNKFYYRELIPKTKRYRYKLIKNANTIESALSLCIEAYNELKICDNRENREAATSKRNQQIGTEELLSKDYSRPIPERQKSRTIKNCVSDFLIEEQNKVEFGLIDQNTQANKKNALEKCLIPYLESIKIYKTNHLKIDAFSEYQNWRVAANSTQKLEITCFKDFIENYCRRNGLLANKIIIEQIQPVFANTDNKFDANPPLISKINFSIIFQELMARKQESIGYDNHRGWYFCMLFYRWCKIAVASGLKPNIELNKLRWCDTKRLKTGLAKGSDKHLRQEWITKIQTREKRAGKQRTIQVIGADTEILEWRKEQQKYIERYCPEVIVNERTLMFGNPYNNMNQYSYSRFSREWLMMMSKIVDRLEPCSFKKRNYTLYSLRSTYICNSLLQGNSIIATAKDAGISISACESYYNKLDLITGRKSKAEVDNAQAKSASNRFASYLSSS